MNISVVCYSKTGNTKKIAEIISETLDCIIINLNIMKKGRKNKEEKKNEEIIFKDAVEYAKKVDMVFIGTPTEFRKPHAKIIDFINAIQPSKVALFCTYYGMLGATLIDMEATCRNNNIPIVGMTDIRIGTEKYRFRKNVNEYLENITNIHIQQVKEFAMKCLDNHRTISPRLTGVCGKNCINCNLFQKKCKGASYQCWSGKHCEIFNCCVIKKSLKKCSNCNKYIQCEKNQNLKNQIFLEK